MIPWKIRWAASQLFSKKVFSENLKTLNNPWIYYIALIIFLLHIRVKQGFTFKLKQIGCFSIHDFIGCYLYWEIFLYNCYHLHPGNNSHITIADVGAHTGLSAIRFKQIFPDAEIHCYEPYTGHYDHLRQNLTRCKLPNTILHRQGVAESRKSATFYLHGSNSGAHSLYPVDRPAGEMTIDLIDLEEVLSRTSTGSIDILKLDCEGAEYEIIKSIDQPMAGKIREIIYEATIDKYDPKELTDHLNSIGYDTVDLDGTVFKATLRSSSSDA